MKYIATVFVLSFAVEFLVDGNARTLLRKSASARSSASAKSDTRGGTAAASTTAMSTGGTAEAVASATSEAFTEVSSKLVDYFKFVFDNVKRKSVRQSDDDYCQDALAVIEQELESVGGVVATAYTEALSTVEITGTGSACAQGDAASSSQASGFAGILAEAISKASYKFTKARAETSVEVVVDVLALAFSNAFSSACLEDEGSALALQTSFARAVIRPIAAVSVYVASGVDCKQKSGYSITEIEAEARAEEDVEAKTESISEVVGKGTAETEGSADAVTQELERCSGIYMMCCRVRGGNTCTCSVTRTARCSARLVYGDVPYWEEGDMRCTCSRRNYFTDGIRIEQ